MASSLPVRSEIKKLQYHRQPTPAEIHQGYGAIHYREFPVEDCCFPGTRIAKAWFVAKDDGLRYYK